jgi:hypothetical protein
MWLLKGKTELMQTHTHPSDPLTLNKMAPERPLSRMANEILCPCPVWELALFALLLKSPILDINI